MMGRGEKAKPYQVPIVRPPWEWATKEERRDLTRMVIQEVGVDVATKRVIWIKARPKV